MARKKIREYDAKLLLAKHLPGIKVQSIVVTPDTNLAALEQEYSWLQKPLVVKPDQLFGKRKKLGLVLMNVGYDKVKEFIQQHQYKEVTIGKAKDTLTNFLIEPFIPHDHEYYLAFTSEREHDTIYFSVQGGVDVEENWDSIIKIDVPTLFNINDVAFPLTIPRQMIRWIDALFNAYRDLDFTYLELNPFTIEGDKLIPLDTVAIIDDCAAFKNKQRWGNLEFPREFGKKTFPEEERIERIDRDSGASLKLTVLNPKGTIWNILGGGGASIIYLDMIANLGKGNDIANYGETSGNPSTSESYEYAKTILELMIKNNGKILFIVGGIANFTDVRETFTGFIQALEEYAPQLKGQDISVFVRRGGPHYEEGLRLIRNAGERFGIPMKVHGPETSMPEIIRIAGTSI